jgi:hypothetical protein
MQLLCLLNHAIALLLTGQTTDSGGGGASELLMEESKRRNPCTPTHLVASCTLHAAKKTLGEGKLERQNMMKMLHSACNLQECVEFGEFKSTMLEAALWVQQKQDGNSPMNPKTRAF